MKTSLIIFFFILQALAVSSQDFWEEVLLPDSITPASVSFNSDSHIYLSSSHGLYKSTDEGCSWNILLHYLASLHSIVRGQFEIFVGIDSFGFLYHSLDDGASWDTINSNITGIHLKMISDTVLFCLGWGKIYRSDDFGNTWIQVQSTVNGELFNDIVEKDSTLFAGSINFLDPYGGGVYHSLDFGFSWQQISLPGYGISSFEFDSNNYLLSSVNFQYYGNEYGVMRSIDNGINWINILWGYIVTSLAVDINGGIYAGCDSDFGPEGIQFSSNNGITWDQLNTGLHENASINSIDISPDGFIYVITDTPSKLYRSTYPIVNINELEYSYSKLILYPNPCNNLLNIRFKGHPSTSNNQDYSVKIINSLGNVIIDMKVIFDFNNSISFNIEKLTTGIYFIKIYDNAESYKGMFIKN